MTLNSGVDLNVAAERAYITPLSNSTLLPLLLLSLARQKHSPETASKVKKEYDYVVVGAGAAGSVVASRLSEVSCVSVLLLEAGPPPPRLVEVPAISRSFWFTDLDWQYKTTPQRYTGRGLANRSLTWPAGRGLGGSTAIYGSIYTRGNRQNYDDWSTLGAKGWSYREVLPYFKKMEDNRNPSIVANGYHGVGGPFTVMRPRYESEVQRQLYSTARAMGYKIVDSNGKRQTGYTDFQASLRDSQKCTTAKTYLVPAENRTNLDILPNAFVRKVIVENRRAKGVSFDFEGKTYRVRARREVIVSAGATKTPQLLMLSGIGPKEELRKFNIPVHADLPVGRNLQDHIAGSLEFTLRPGIPEITEKLSSDENIERYIHNRTGILASVEGCSAIAFLKNNEINPKTDFPDHQLYFAETSNNAALRYFNLKPEVYQQVYAPYENRASLFCASQLLQPRSRGSVTLQSDDPYDAPLIDPNYLADPKDVDDIVGGLKACNRILTSPRMQKWVRPFETEYPGCEEYRDDEDALYRCRTRSVVVTFSHYSGTARMGDPRDPAVVVDPQLRVKNIPDLRVVDASVMPIVTSGNTGIPTIMIAEKASDVIKESIRCHRKDHESDHSEQPSSHRDDDDPKTHEPSRGNEDYSDYPSRMPYEGVLDSEHNPPDSYEDSHYKPASFLEDSEFQPEILLKEDNAFYGRPNSHKKGTKHKDPYYEEDRDYGPEKTYEATEYDPQSFFEGFSFLNPYKGFEEMMT